MPEQVREKIKIFPFVTNKEEFRLHVSMQEDRPFLIFESSPVKASVIDVLTGADVLQRAIVSCKRDLFRHESELSVSESHLLDVRGKLLKLEGIEVLQQRVGVLERDELVLKRLESRLEKLTDLKQRLVVLNDRIEFLSKFKHYDITDLVNSKLRLEVKKERFSTLLFYKRTIEKCAEYNDAVIPEIGNILVLKGRISALKEREEKLCELRTNLDEKRNLISSAETSLVKLEKEFEKLKELKKVCPTCGRPL